MNYFFIRSIIHIDSLVQPRGRSQIMCPFRIFTLQSDPPSPYEQGCTFDQPPLKITLWTFSYPPFSIFVINWSQNIPLSLTGHVICERLAPKQGRLAIPIDFIRLHFNPTD